MKKGKGQVALEFLVIFAAFLAFLAAVLPAMAGAKEKAESGVEAAYLKEAAARLGAALDSVCLMGEGNRRVVDIRLAREAELELRGDRLFLISGANSVREDLLCEAAGMTMALPKEGKIDVYWQDGKAAVGPHTSTPEVPA